MLFKLKRTYKKLPFRTRAKLSKIIWYAKRLDALFYKLQKLNLFGKTFKNWKVEGNLTLLDKLELSKDSKSFIVFPVIDWDFRIQRPQHICRELGASGNVVVYFSTTFNLSDAPGFKLLDNPSKNIVVCQLNLFSKNKNIYEDNLSNKEVEFLRKSVNAVRLSFNLGYTYSLVNLPFWADLACSLQGNSVVYDCMDHHAGFENNSQQMLNKELELLERSDLVLTTAERLSEKISDHRSNIVIRNAAEVKFFSQKDPRILYSKTRTVVGYYGAIAEWFDLDLLCFIAQEMPEVTFVVIGNVTVEIDEAEKFENIQFLGEVPYNDLPAYLNSIDVCLIPFKLIELTLCTNPVKVYEYLAAGKPVVATAMPEVELMSDYVHIGYDYKDFLAKIRLAIEEVGNKNLAENRTQWALTHDWSSRAGEIIQHLECIPSEGKKVSLIVLTYNNLDLTKICIESILSNTTYKNYEIIIVDNLSTDGTQQYLTNNYSNNNRIKIILNEDNLGFAAGNNVGLLSADGEILLIINNDTCVSPYWLEPIVSALEDNTIGLVCPVTNNIGNEAKINIQYETLGEMPVKALDYTSSSAGKRYPMDAVAFYCVAMRRDTYEKVGPMCEDYGIGFFEDDDYSIRVRNEGLQNFAIDESFVHHHLSASFNKLGEERKQKIMMDNKAIFESKWGAWKPHSYRKGVY